MCHNIIDGRFYDECGHFLEMSSRRQDCLRTNCLFSMRHSHDQKKCGASNCVRLMALPAKNPIRRSPDMCPNCKDAAARS